MARTLARRRGACARVPVDRGCVAGRERDTLDLLMRELDDDLAHDEYDVTRGP